MAKRSPTISSLDLYWIPLGAGASVVRTNGVLYETVTATIQRRPRCDLYHSALEIVLPEGRFMVEMTPVPDPRGWADRGVVTEGPVAIRAGQRLRILRYEVRRWRDGVVPDLTYAVASPIRLSTDLPTVRAVFDVLPNTPRLVWGRDESGAGEMWSCNSITSWALTRANLDTLDIELPDHGRAPGWDAGRIVAQSATHHANAPV